MAPDFLGALVAWLDAPTPLADEAVRQGLRRWVPEYAPSGERPTLTVVAGTPGVAAQGG